MKHRLLDPPTCSHHMPNILGLDISPTKVGVAFSSPTDGCAIPLATLVRRSSKKNKKQHNDEFVSQQLKAIVSDYEVSQFIIGWPLELSGARSISCENVLLFTHFLHLEGLITNDSPGCLWDERMSTSLAYSIAVEAMVPGRTSKDSRPPRAGAEYRAAEKFRKSGGEDSMAATIILQGFCDH